MLMKVFLLCIGKKKDLPIIVIIEIASWKSRVCLGFQELNEIWKTDVFVGNMVDLHLHTFSVWIMQ